MQQLCQTLHGPRRGRPYSQGQCMSTQLTKTALHFRFLDPLHSSRPISVRLHRHDDTFRSARGHGACCTFGSAVHLQTHGDDLCLHLANRREDIGMQRVGYAVSGVGCDDDFGQFISTICGVLISLPRIDDCLLLRYTAPESFPCLHASPEPPNSVSILSIS